jgi:spheroidene monooxygenase
VLTRATIRPSFAPAFWWRVGRVARSLEGRDDLLFTKGVGERPWVEQATFSVWRSTEAMQAFAHGRGGMHAEAIARTRKAQGFREELYARFTVLRTEGSWKGGDPVRG